MEFNVQSNTFMGTDGRLIIEYMLIYRNIHYVKSELNFSDRTWHRKCGRLNEYLIKNNLKPIKANHHYDENDFQAYYELLNALYKDKNLELNNDELVIFLLCLNFKNSKCMKKEFMYRYYFSESAFTKIVNLAKNKYNWDLKKAQTDKEEYFTNLAHWLRKNVNQINYNKIINNFTTQLFLPVILQKMIGDLCKKYNTSLINIMKKYSNNKLLQTMQTNNNKNLNFSDLKKILKKILNKINPIIKFSESFFSLIKDFLTSYDVNYINNLDKLQGNSTLQLIKKCVEKEMPKLILFSENQNIQYVKDCLVFYFLIHIKKEVFDINFKILLIENKQKNEVLKILQKNFTNAKIKIDNFQNYASLTEETKPIFHLQMASNNAGIIDKNLILFDESQLLLNNFLGSKDWLKILDYCLLNLPNNS